MKTRGNEFLGPGPIFIGGLSFSGKTILHSILSVHPNIIVTRHTSMWPRYYQHYGELRQPNNFMRCLTAMLQDKNIQALKPNPERIRREFWQGTPSYGRLFGLFHEHYAEQQGKSRWGDQLSLIEGFIKPILSCYPNAKMIHMIRDPRERYRECIERSSHRRWKVGYETANWLQSAKLAERNYHQYQDSYKVVRYESLISEPEATTKDICDFLHEDFSFRMIASVIEKDPGERDHPRASVDCGSISKSRDITEREIWQIQMHAKHHMLANGYPLKPIRLTLAERISFYAIDWPKNLASMGVGNIYHNRRERSL